MMNCSNVFVIKSHLLQPIFSEIQKTRRLCMNAAECLQRANFVTDVVPTITVSDSLCLSFVLIRESNDNCFAYYQVYQFFKEILIL